MGNTPKRKSNLHLLQSPYICGLGGAFSIEQALRRSPTPISSRPILPSRSWIHSYSPRL